MTDFEKLSRTFSDLELEYDLGGYNNGSFIALINKLNDNTEDLTYFVFSEDGSFIGIDNE